MNSVQSGSCRLADCRLRQHWHGFGLWWRSHPMGEARRKALAAHGCAGEDQSVLVVHMLVGHIHVRRDESAAPTPHGQLVFFAELLAAAWVSKRWISNCPQKYPSRNAPDKRDVLGTVMLGLLKGHRRCARITAPRGDAIAA